MSRKVKSHSLLVRVLSSPFAEDYPPENDNPPPWDYEEDNFIGWVDDVFCEGYKRQSDDLEGRPQTLEEALEILISNGYDVILIKNKKGNKNEPGR